MTTTDEVRPVYIDAPEARTSKLFLVEDLNDADRTRDLAEDDLKALHAVADWTKTFVAQANKDLGRSGAVCPFTALALEHKTLWLAAERSAGRSREEVIDLIESYKRMLLTSQPVRGDLAGNRTIMVVFTDLPAPHAKDFIGGALEPIAIPSYVNDGLVMGPFYEGNDGAALYNPNFHPFTSPVPFLLMRLAVISDWKFFLNDEVWLGRWARRYGEAATETLASEMRRLPWRLVRQ